MIEEAEFELVEGTGNVFRDLGDPDAVLKQARRSWLPTSSPR